MSVKFWAERTPVRCQKRTILQRCPGAEPGGGRLPIAGDAEARGRSGLKTDSGKANRKDERRLDQLCREGEGVKFTKEENTLWEFSMSMSLRSLVTAVDREVTAIWQ